MVARCDAQGYAARKTPDNKQSGSQDKPVDDGNLRGHHTDLKVDRKPARPPDQNGEAIQYRGAHGTDLTGSLQAPESFVGSTHHKAGWALCAVLEPGDSLGKCFSVDDTNIFRRIIISPEGFLDDPGQVRFFLGRSLSFANAATELDHRPAPLLGSISEIVMPKDRIKQL